MDDQAIVAKKKSLSQDEYRVCFLKGTEPPFSGKYYTHHKKGMYVCVVCTAPLFESSTKFDSGTGWPSFWDTAGGDAVKKELDNSYGMVRTEVLCRRCGAHLGHVFDDGPKVTSGGKSTTGLRYCINSLSLDFVPIDGEEVGK